MDVVLVANTNGRLAIPALAGLFVHLRTVAPSSFLHQTVWQYSDEDRLTRTSNARGRPIISLYLGNDTR